MTIRQLDHLVLTVQNIDTTVHFYTTVLKMKKETFGENRVALRFGNQKINLHTLDEKCFPKAKNTSIGSYDLCFIVEEDIKEVYQALRLKKIEILEGIVERQGTHGIMGSLYFYDPDGNLIELSNYI